MTKALILLCLAAAALVGAEWWLWPQWRPPVSAGRIAGPQEAAAPSGAADPAGADWRLPPFEHYEAIKARPIFIEGRRPLPDEPEAPPPEAPPPPPPPKSPPPRIAISGILITPQDRYAMLRNPPKEGPSRLRKGDDFQGWRVEEITRDGLRLSQAGESHEISLWNYQQVPLPVLPPAGATPPPDAPPQAPPNPQAMPQPVAAAPLPAMPPGMGDPRTRRPMPHPAVPPAAPPAVPPAR